MIMISQRSTVETSKHKYNIFSPISVVFVIRFVWDVNFTM